MADGEFELVDNWNRQEGCEEVGCGVDDAGDEQVKALIDANTVRGQGEGPVGCYRSFYSRISSTALQRVKRKKTNRHWKTTMKQNSVPCTATTAMALMTTRGNIPEVFETTR